MMRLFPFLSVCCGVAMLMQPVMAEPLMFQGEVITTDRNAMNSIVSMQLSWKQDIAASRQNDMLCTLGESDVQEAYAALNDYVQAASGAQAALVNYAVYSMTPLQTTQPELYRRKVEFVLNLIAGDRLPCEFITNIALENAR